MRSGSRLEGVRRLDRRRGSRPGCWHVELSNENQVAVCSIRFGLVTSAASTRRQGGGRRWGRSDITDSSTPLRSGWKRGPKLREEMSEDIAAQEARHRLTSACPGRGHRFNLEIQRNRRASGPDRRAAGERNSAGRRTGQGAPENIRVTEFLDQPQPAAHWDAGGRARRGNRERLALALVNEASSMISQAGSPKSSSDPISWRRRSRRRMAPPCSIIGDIGRRLSTRRAARRVKSA